MRRIFLLYLDYFLVVSVVTVVVTFVVSTLVVSTGVTGVTVVLVSTVTVELLSFVVVVSAESLQATIVAAIAKTAINFFMFVVRF